MVDGRLAKRKSSDRQSSRSLNASTKVGYLSLMIWSRVSFGARFFSNRAASPTSPRPRDREIFFASAF